MYSTSNILYSYEVEGGGVQRKKIKSKVVTSETINDLAQDDFLRSLRSANVSLIDPDIYYDSLSDTEIYTHGSPTLRASNQPKITKFFASNKEDASDEDDASDTSDDDASDDNDDDASNDDASDDEDEDNDDVSDVSDASEDGDDDASNASNASDKHKKVKFVKSAKFTKSTKGIGDFIETDPTEDNVRPVTFSLHDFIE